MDTTSAHDKKFYAWWRDVAEGMPKGEDRQWMVGIIGIAAWLIWKERNSAIFEKKTPDPIAVIKRIKRMADEFFESRKKGLKEKQKVPKGSCWRLPEEGSVKINCDAAVDRERGFGATGILARDSAGRVISGRNAILQQSECLVLEAMTVKEAFLLAQLSGWRKVNIESDSREVVRQMRLICPGGNGLE